MENYDQKKLLKEIKHTNILVFITLLLLSTLFSSSYFAAGVAIGGVLILLNFKILERIIFKAFSSIDHVHKQKKLILIKYYLRLFGMGIILFILIFWDIVHPLGLVIGLSTVVLSLFIKALKEIYRIILLKSKEAI